MTDTCITQAETAVCLQNRYYAISVDLDSGAWSVEDRRTGESYLTAGEFRLDKGSRRDWQKPETAMEWSQREVASCFGTAIELRVGYFPRDGYEPIRFLNLRLYPEASFIEIGWGVRNPHAHAVRVRNVELLHRGELFNGRRIDSARVLKSGAGAEPNMVEKGASVDAFNGVLLTGKDRGRRRSLVAGGLAYAEFARVVEIVETAVGKSEKMSRFLTLSCHDPHGKAIEPGDSFWSADTAYLDFVTADPFKALEQYGDALRLANDADPNVYDFPTLCGWMVSRKSYGEGAPINNSVGLVEQTRIAQERGLMKYTPLAVRLEPDTYCYGNQGNTQQGWWDNQHWAAYGPGSGQQKASGEGSLREPYETFRKFCQAVAELGGIPFTYFQCSMPSNDFALAHPDWMLNKDISLLHHTHAHHRPLVRYDYTNAEFQEHCLAVWRRLRRAGLKGVKFDYPETAWNSQGGFDDTSATTTSAYRALFRLCREGLGPQAFLHERNLGGKVHEDAPRLDVTAGVVDLQRVWGDASHFEPEMASRIGLRWYKSRRVFLYYPDGKSFIKNGKPIPAYKRRCFLTMIAFLSGRLEIGTSIGTMTDAMLHDMTRLFPMFSGVRSPRPVDMLAGTEHPSVYLYAVNTAWWQVMLVNNTGKGRKPVAAAVAGDPAETGALGLDADGRYHAFDFWNQSYLGEYGGSDVLSVDLRVGEAAMISVRTVAAHPQMLSTNRHIMQGMMECHNVTWSAGERLLSGEADVIGGEDFVLTLAANGWVPLECDGGVMRKLDSGLIELVFQTPENSRIPFGVTFEPPEQR